MFAANRWNIHATLDILVGRMEISRLVDYQSDSRWPPSIPIGRTLSNLAKLISITISQLIKPMYL